MSKYLLKLAAMFTIVFFVCGCNATKDVKVRNYMQDKARVDQKIEGNVGYILGSPSEEELKSPEKKTRKIYVLEFTKDIEKQAAAEQKENTVKKTVYTEGEFETRSVETKMEIRKTPEIVIPSFEDEYIDEFDNFDEEESFDADSEEGYVRYTVQKNDTLQKISKKFYGSYSKWTKIYEVNKAKLKNPDVLSEGIILRIPEE